MKIFKIFALLLVFMAGFLNDINAQYVGEDRSWSGIQSRDSLAARVDTADFKVITSRVDSLAGASEIWDLLLNTRLDSVRDNSGGITSDSYMWIDTTQYDFLLVDDSDTTNYEFIRKFSHTFAFSGDLSDSTQDAKFEAFLIETQRLNKEVVDVACSFDTLFFSDTTYFDTTLTSTVRFHAVNRPGVVAYKPMFYKTRFNYNQWEASVRIDSNMTAYTGIGGSYGRLEYYGMGFSAPVSIYTGSGNFFLNGIIAGGSSYDAVSYLYDNCYIKGSLGSFATYPMYREDEINAVTTFNACYLDTMSLRWDGSGGSTYMTDCRGSIGTFDGWISTGQNWYWYVRGFIGYASRMTCNNNSYLFINGCDVTQLTTASPFLENHVYAENCTFTFQSGATRYYVYGDWFYNCTFYKGGVAANAGEISNCVFRNSTVGIVATSGNAATRILNNTFSYCTTAISFGSNAKAYGNIGLSNTTWAAGTPLDSTFNSWH